MTRLLILLGLIVPLATAAQDVDPAPPTEAPSEVARPFLFEVRGHGSAGWILGTVHLADSAAIALYLADRYPAAGLAPYLLASAALEQINARKRTQMFVVEKGKPVGVVHVHDLLRAGIA